MDPLRHVQIRGQGLQKHVILETNISFTSALNPKQILKPVPLWVGRGGEAGDADPTLAGLGAFG